MSIEKLTEALTILFNKVVSPNCPDTADFLLAISYVLTSLPGQDQVGYFTALMVPIQDIFQSDDLLAIEIMLDLFNSLYKKLPTLIDSQANQIFTLIFHLFSNQSLHRLDIYPPLILCFSNVLCFESCQFDYVENFLNIYFEILLQYFGKLNLIDFHEFREFVDLMIGSLACGFKAFSLRARENLRDPAFEKNVLLQIVSFSRFIFGFGRPSENTFRFLLEMFE